MVQLFVCVNVCIRDKGRLVLLVVNEYTKVLDILVKITEPKEISVHHEVGLFALCINTSGKL
jgi:hypothetical protein